MSRRAHGEGSLYRRGDGRWCASIRFEDPVTRERDRMTVYARTKREARDKLRAAIARIDSGSPVRDSNAPVATWLRHWRETSLRASDRKETTKENYARLSRHHLETGAIAQIPIGRLRPTDIDKLMIELDEKGLSRATSQRIFNILRMALAGAVRDGLIARSPMVDMTQPKAESREAAFLSATEVKRLLEAARESRYHSLLTLIAHTGLRKGEALALRWDDLDLGKGTLRVCGTLARIDKKLVVTEPKTDKSRRTLALEASTVALLKAHRKTQAEERLRAGDKWLDSGHVFATEFGGPLEPTNALRALRAAAEASGLEGVCLHTLRHSAAAIWLENGVSLKAVSELLGHADAAITARVYAHVRPETKEAAMTVLADAIAK